jgi:hypothetical protein
MTYRSAVLIDTRFQPGAKTRAASNSLQRFSAEPKTVETVLDFAVGFTWLKQVSMKTP